MMSDISLFSSRVLFLMSLVIYLEQHYSLIYFEAEFTSEIISLSQWSSHSKSIAH